MLDQPAHENFLPNFLIIGAAKSGTTFLNNILKQHSEIFLPNNKECRFFSNIGNAVIDPFTGERLIDLSIVETIDGYQHNFSKVKNEKLIGDISPDYLYYYKNAVSRIKLHLQPDVKIIIVLRDPIERAYSNYYHLIRDNLTSVSFGEYIELEKTFPEKTTWYGFNIVQTGFYYHAVKAYRDNFSSVKIILFENLIGNTEASLREIYDFLGVSSEAAYKSVWKNKTGAPRSKIIKRIIDAISKMTILKRILYNVFPKRFLKSAFNKIKDTNLKKNEMSMADRRTLSRMYKDDIKELEQILNMNLQMWKA